MNDSMEEVVSGQLKREEAREREVVEGMDTPVRQRWVDRVGKQQSQCEVGRIAFRYPSRCPASFQLRSDQTLR